MKVRLFVLTAGFTLLIGTRAALASPKLDISPPRIQQAPSEIFYRRTFVIVSPDAPEVVKVGMLSVNIEGGGSRSATLTIVGRTPTTLTVEAPATPGEAPPGQYLLFIYAQGLKELVPSLPALLTLSVPPTSPAPRPTSTSPAGHRSPTPPGSKGRNGGNGSAQRATGGPGSGTGVTKSGPPSAAVARPASGVRSLGAEPWIGSALLVLLLATFFGLRRMLRA